MQLSPALKKKNPCGCEVILCGIKPENTKTWLRVRENQNIGGPNDSTAQVQTSEVFMCPWGVCCEWLQRASGTLVAKWTSFAGAVELMNRRCLSWQSFNTMPSHRLIIQQHLLSTWLYVAGGNGKSHMGHAKIVKIYRCFLAPVHPMELEGLSLMAG